MLTRYGGFLDAVDRFDAGFFGIAPREAESMDPQQRLLLEIAWEALEDAGHSPQSLAGSQTGVYVGISNSDYGRAMMAQRNQLHVYSASGGAFSVAAGRLSYFLGLHGPSLAVDTACSSSLAAVHLACQALRLGECDMALAGGVNLILSPEANIGFSKAGMMAPDGHCKTFDAAADGYVRSEGCAMIVLRHLADAVADGDRVLAVIRGSALNQDGRSGGLTAPNGPAQEAVIRAALDAAGVAPREVGYIETHGTGTSLGDPIEVGALGNVFGGDRDAAGPLVIGSVKTNIGHLEAAAGIAGLIKVVLMLQRGEIPPHLHFTNPSPHIDWANLPIRVSTGVTPWAPGAARPVAGVSSFGFSGTNAHVVLEAPPAPEAPAAGLARPLHLLTLSARDDAALEDLVVRYDTRLADGGDVADICFTANSGRAHFRRRLAIVGASTAALRQGLRDHRAGRESVHVAVSSATRAAKPRVAFLFTGFGAQQHGMARQLYETSPVFRAALDRCGKLLASHLDRPLADVLFADAGQGDSLDDPAYGHPALFAVEYALAQLWTSWGIEPVAVLGHSLGEYAAACVAGVLRLEDALRLVAERGRLSRDLPSGSSMLAVTAPEGIVAEEISRADELLVIAAYNGPAKFVLSGTSAAVGAAADRFRARGFETKSVRVSKGFHSPLVDAALPELLEVATGIEFAAPEVDLISNVTGRRASPGQVERAEYWVEHMRSPVRFSDSLRTLAGLGVTHCVEIGPHPVLCALGAECLPDEPIAWLPSLRRGRDDWAELLESLQSLYVDGADVDWRGFDHGYARRRVPLPTYPFRRRRYWDENLAVSPPEPAPVAPADLATIMTRQSEQGPLDFAAAAYPERLALLARLTSAHALRTLREAGVFARAGERHTLDEVLGVAGFGAGYRHLVERWLRDLVQRGLLRWSSTGFVSDSPLPDPQLDVLWQDVERSIGDDPPLLRYLRRCGELVGAVLTGRVSPLETLFPGGSFELAEDLYRCSAIMRYINAIAAAGIEVLSAAVPPGRMLRVLEVGAGTGGTTASLLARLPAERTHYVFTDVSQVFLDRAKEAFADRTFVDYRIFDLERDPLSQGYAAGGFDVIVAANAVHATRDLRVALKHLHSLLAPGGTLLLVESTQHHAWFDMTTGLIEGWQRFADGLRDDNPLLTPSQWCAALGEAGFESAAAWPTAGSVAAAFGQHVITGRVHGHAVAAAFREPGPGQQPDGHAAAPVAGGADENPVRARIAAALPSERIEILRDFVRDRVKKVLRLAADQIPGRSERLMDLGFDSLMAVQLRGQLSKGLGLDRPLPATLIFDHPTIDAIAEYLLGRIDPQPAEAPAPAATSADASREARAAEVAGMSDAEIEALLKQRLESP